VRRPLAERLHCSGSYDPRGIRWHFNPADDSAFAAALAAARNEPENDAHWELAEQLAEVLQRVDEVAAAYREALGQNLSPELAGSLGRRAATYHETWLADDNASLTQVLLRVLAVVPDAEWAFMKLTAAYTLAERWQDLLALYDQTLVAPIGEARRVQVLEEAAHIARDFAGQADRAVDYMHQLLGLRPNDERLEASLERLLERQERWADLIALWKRRIELQGREATPGLQARIAETALDRLHAADSRSTRCARCCPTRRRTATAARCSSGSSCCRRRRRACGPGRSSCCAPPTRTRAALKR
jgi:tetratricopeptide (TPR) repeat protein